MRARGSSCLLLLLLSVGWDAGHCLCSLDNYTAALCHDLEDARYINTYHLDALRAPSASKILGPGNFDNLTSLRHLDLSNGNIVVIKSGSFAKLASLQTLNLANNRISHLEAGAFDGLKRVYSLKLDGNAIRQLPSALMSLKELKLLDISDNGLNCNCASLKLRDALLARGIKIGKRTYCAEPSGVKYASVFKPETQATCAFEKQDTEMQRDQPLLEEVAEGSGEVEGEDGTSEGEKDSTYEEREEDQSLTSESDEGRAVGGTSTESAPTASTTTSTASTTSTGESTAAESALSSTGLPKDDITFFEETEESVRRETTTTASLAAAVKPDELEEEEEEQEERSEDTSEELASEEAVAVGHPGTSESSLPSSGTFSTSGASTKELVVPEEGSGESDDDGSGSEGSGIIARMPAIDFNETSGGGGGGGGFDEDEAQASSSSTTTTTESSSWWGLGSIISNLNPWGSSETSATPSTTERSAEDDLKEEQFIQVTTDSADVVGSQDPTAPRIVPHVLPTDEGATKHSPATQDLASTKSFEESGVDTTPSQDSKKGIGSYIVLITLLVVLAVLLGFAAYKGDFCRKKRKRRDVERGTEMKDMQRTLLEQSGTQPKVQAMNGSTMENVPLMNSASLPDEPRNNQKRYEVSPTTPLTNNGSTKTNGTAVDVNDPVKPSRKSLKQEIEAPLNGLNPPMEAIDAPTRTSLHSESNEIIDAADYCEQPPLTPGAHRVKITLQDNPDSVPKTPILITRMKDAERLIKAP